MYYILVFFGCLIFSGGLLLIKRPFQRLALATVSLLNIILDSEANEDVRQGKLIQGVGLVLKWLTLFLLLIILFGIFAIIPSWLYLACYPGIQADTSSLYFWGILMIAFIPLIFLPQGGKANSAYSSWAKLLHRMILNNFQISKALLNFEKKFYLKKCPAKIDDFIIVTGLARAGTTAFTEVLHQVGNFASLSYANMPFLLAVNLWGKVYRPSGKKKKERYHGDKVLFGFDTIEALEEYFFKVMLNDSFIQEKSLLEHEIDEKTYDTYLQYQSLIKGSGNEKAIYLAKNNNMLLRYESLRSFNVGFKLVLVYRDPLQQAQSLLHQHKRFLKLQHEDNFSLEYMDWLCHHEFGIHQKHFKFSDQDYQNQYDMLTLDFWVVIWINYYQKALQIANSGNVIFIDYEDFLVYPKELFKQLSQNLNKSFSTSGIKKFEKPIPTIELMNKKLKAKSYLIIGQLQQLKIKPEHH